MKKDRLVLFVFMCCVFTLTLQGNAKTWAQNISIRDAAGKTIGFESLPKRLVVVGAAPFIPLHMLYMFEEVRDRLVGFEAKVKKDDEFLKLVDPDYNRKIKLASNPGPESIAALKPDLVIVKSTVETAISRSLEKIGIPVMHLGAETPDLFLKDILMLGKIFGNLDRSLTLLQYYHEKLNLIQDKTSAVPKGSIPGVLQLEYSNRGKHLTLNVPAKSMIQTHQVVLAGGNPVWDQDLTAMDGWQLSGFEQIAAWNPDRIFLVVWYQLKGPAVLKQLVRDDKWSHLTAVKNHHLYLFPKDFYGWDTATPRWILGTLWMATKIYPDLFDQEARGFEQIVADFFKQIYALDENTTKEKILPRVKL